MLYREVVLSASFRSQLQQSSACFFYLGFFLQGVEQASAGAGGQAGGVPTPSSTDCRQQVPVSIHYKVETLSHSFSCLGGGGGGGELRVIVRSPTVFLIVTTSD